MKLLERGTTMRGVNRVWWAIAGLSAWAGALAACSDSDGNATADGGASSSSGGSSGASSSGGDSAAVHDSGTLDGGGVSDGTVADSGSPGADGGLAFTAQFATVSCTTPDTSPFPNGSQTSLSLSSISVSCSELASELAAFADASTDGGLDDAEISELDNLVKNSESLQFALFASTPTLEATTYTVTPPCGYFYGGPVFTATGSYTAFNANGIQSVSDQAASGTLTLTAVSATEIAGSYDVAFATESVVQAACNAWAVKCAAAINGNETCLPDFDGGSLEDLTGTFTVPICTPPVCKTDGG